MNKQASGEITTTIHRGDGRQLPEIIWKPISEHSEEFWEGDQYLIAVPVSVRGHPGFHYEYHVITVSEHLGWADSSGMQWLDWEWADVDFYIKLSNKG